MFKSQIILTIFLCFSSFVFGQTFVPDIEWQKCFGSSFLEAGTSIITTSDGGYIYTANTTPWDNGDLAGVPIHGNKDIWVVKLSANRTIQWQKLLGGTKDESAFSIVQTTDGGYLVAGETESNDDDVSNNHGNKDIWVVKLSAQGSIQWQKCYGGSATENFGSLVKTYDGGYILTGDTRSMDGDIIGQHGYVDGWVVKLSSTGSIEWQKCYGGTFFTILKSINQTKDGGYIIAGYTASTDGDVIGCTGSINEWIVKISSLGVIEWQKCLGGSHDERANSIIQTLDGGYIVVGSAISNDRDVSGNHGGVDAWVVKLSRLGVIEWQKCLGGSSKEEALTVVQTSDAGFIVVIEASSKDGDISNAHSFYTDEWIVKLSPLGNIEWQKSLGGTGNDVSRSCVLTPDGGLVIIGETGSFDYDVIGNHGNTDVWLVKLSPPTKTIVGRVQQTNTFCQPLTPPQYIANSLVKIEKNNTFHYTSTDSLGYYGVFVDTGSYTISSIPLNSLWTACPPQTINIINPNIRETITVNPNLYINSLCPLMEVELTTPFLRRCFESQYVINYANRGTAIQTDGVVELTLDTMLSFVSATRPIKARNGNKISFSIGNIGINQVGQFNVTVMVNCNSRLGQTHCSSVFIPKTAICDTIRDTIPTIAIPCSGCDSTTFHVTKPTTGQNQAYQYRLIADASTIDTGRFVLTNTFSLKRKNDGRTYRLELRNVNNNQLIAARAVESTSSNTPSVSTGFVNQFSRGVKLSNFTENCTVNRGAFDPNEKSAIPVGVGTSHYVEQGTTLEYLVQFQNTGTDTAFTVVVKDTLSSNFNYSSLKMAATSHPASWELKPNGLLTVTFKNIQLVDSFTNERGSHGFFKYQIRLKDSIATGTRLDNKAAIYFDFNAPIITNLASHTIGKEFLKNCLAKPSVTASFTGCPTKNITFSAVVKNSGLTPTYKWFRNAETTPLSTNANFTLNNMTNGTKIYCKINASTELCTETPIAVSDTIKISCINTKTDDIATLQSFDIYPNPNKGVFDINIQLAKTAEIQVNIVNTLGQILKTERILSDHFSEKYDLSHIATGLYFVKLTVDGQTVVKRVSVQ